MYDGPLIKDRDTTKPMQHSTRIYVPVAGFSVLPFHCLPQPFALGCNANPNFGKYLPSRNVARDDELETLEW